MEPSSVAGAIIYGIIGGVATTGILFIVVETFRRIVVPWYVNLVYKSARIDGEWEVVKVGTDQTAKLEIEQHADRLSGTCTFMTQTDDEEWEKLRSCTVTGTIRDRIVNLSFRHTSATRIGEGAFVLELVGDGRRMQGYQTFYNVAHSGITSDSLLIVRPGARRDKDAQLLIAQAAPEQAVREALRDAVRKEKRQTPRKPRKRTGKGKPSAEDKVASFH